MDDAAAAASSPESEVHRLDERLDGAGEDRRLIPTAGAFLAAAQPQAAELKPAPDVPASAPMLTTAARSGELAPA